MNIATARFGAWPLRLDQRFGPVDAHGNAYGAGHGDPRQMAIPGRMITSAGAQIFATLMRVIYHHRDPLARNEGLAPVGVVSASAVTDQGVGLAQCVHPVAECC